MVLVLAAVGRGLAGLAAGLGLILGGEFGLPLGIAEEALRQRESAPVGSGAAGAARSDRNLTSTHTEGKAIAAGPRPRANWGPPLSL